MSEICQGQTFYRSLLNRQITTQTIDLIIIATLLPLQFILMIFIFVKGYKRFRKILMERQHQLVVRRVSQIEQKLRGRKENDKINEAIQKNVQNENFPQNNKDFIEKILYKNSSKIKIVITMTIFFILLGLIMVLLTMSFLAIQQTIQNTYTKAECGLNLKMNQFRKGNSNWMGLQNIVPNVTQLNLILSTRIQVSINAIRGLMLNGTVAAIRPGLGFANGTNITVVNKQVPLNLSIIRSSSVKSNINATVRYWLFMNSSLSNVTLFPVCQPNLTYLIQHPFSTGKTIELNYMDEICQKVTKQVDKLVENGGKVDQLLVDLEDVKVRKISLQSNLSVLGQVYATIASRTNQYASQFSSFSYDFATIYLISIMSLASYGGLTIFVTFYIILMLGTICCQSDRNNSRQESEEQSSINIVNTMRQQHKHQQNQNFSNYYRKFNNTSSSFPKLFIFFFIAVNILVSVGSFLYVKKSIDIRQNCQMFNKARQDSVAFNSLNLKTSQKQLLAPIQQCTSGKFTFFMQSVPLITSRFTLQKFYSLSDTYNASVPKDVFKTESLLQVETLKQYLFHLQTMPIKSTQFNLLQILNQVNLYSNGSYQGSKQLEECGRAVIQDQYVYNAVDCKHKLMDLVNEVSITEPRCVILPTYDGTPGTVTTHLNEAQHTFVLNATCPSINNMFSQTNSSCFLGKRIALLQAQNCTKTAIQLGVRLQNLFKFSQKASQYTDIYMQNLRNLFGVYAISSTNLTQFFAGSNMSQTMGAFGVLSNNILNRTRCDQIKPIVDSIYDSYCSEQNSMVKLLSQAYVWTIIVVMGIFVQSIVFFLLDVFLRVYRIDKFYGRKGEENSNKKVSPIANQVNMIEISQQTLVRQNIVENDYIYHDEFKQRPQQSHLHQSQNPIVIIHENTQPYTEVKSKFENYNTFDETGLLFDKYTPSPMKSINPYGTAIDEVVEYPTIGETPKKQEVSNKIIESVHENKPPKEGINFISSIKKTNMIQNQVFDQKDSSVDQKKHQQIKQSQVRQQNQRQGKLMMSKTARRFKKVNIETDEKKIMPQLFFNLDEEQSKTKQVKGRIRSNVKTKNISGRQQKGAELKRQRNFLEINMHDGELDQAKNYKQIEVMNLERIKKAKQSKDRDKDIDKSKDRNKDIGKSKDQQMRQSLTAR